MAFSSTCPFFHSEDYMFPAQVSLPCRSCIRHWLRLSLSSTCRAASASDSPATCMDADAPMSTLPSRSTTRTRAWRCCCVNGHGLRMHRARVPALQGRLPMPLPWAENCWRRWCGARTVTARAAGMWCDVSAGLHTREPMSMWVESYQHRATVAKVHACPKRSVRELPAK